MEGELKKIKKVYGEEFAKMCRDAFPTILEKEGLLSRILVNNFNPTKSLYHDIVSQDKVVEFKKFILNQYDISQNKKLCNNYSNKTPEELMDKAGYILMPECQTEDDIQQFVKYYYPSERLCTFNGGRLNYCRVWFAISKNVDKILRQDFLPNPQRLDKYNTSVLSIQFTKDGTNTLSIIGRYNHTVPFPNCTFSNCLDNIIPGLTDAFAKTYNVVQAHPNMGFELEKYIRANDGRFYRYNFEMDNVFYCENNIIIDGYEPLYYDKAKFTVCENYIFDKENKTATCYIPKINSILGNYSPKDSFINSLGQITSIKDVNNSSEYGIDIETKNGKPIKIRLNRHNQITLYENDNAKQVDKNFLPVCHALKKLKMDNVIFIGPNSCHNAENLRELSLKSIETLSHDCFTSCNKLDTINTPKMTYMSNNCFSCTPNLKTINLKNLTHMGADCFKKVNKLEYANLEKLEIMQDRCFNECYNLERANLGNVAEMGEDCFEYCYNLLNVDLSQLKYINDNCFSYCANLQRLNIPNNLELADNCFNEYIEYKAKNDYDNHYNKEYDCMTR